MVDRIVLTTNDTLDIETLLNPPPTPTPSFFQTSDGDGIVQIEAEAFDESTARGTHVWESVAVTTASGGQAMIALLDVAGTEAAASS